MKAPTKPAKNPAKKKHALTVFLESIIEAIETQPATPVEEPGLLIQEEEDFIGTLSNKLRALVGLRYIYEDELEAKQANFGKKLSRKWEQTLAEGKSHLKEAYLPKAELEQVRNKLAIINALLRMGVELDYPTQCIGADVESRKLALRKWWHIVAEKPKAPRPRMLSLGELSPALPLFFCGDSPYRQPVSGSVLEAIFGPNPLAGFPFDGDEALRSELTHEQFARIFAPGGPFGGLCSGCRPKWKEPETPEELCARGAAAERHFEQVLAEARGVAAPTAGVPEATCDPTEEVPTFTDEPVMPFAEIPIPPETATSAESSGTPVMPLPKFPAAPVPVAEAPAEVQFSDEAEAAAAEGH